jgi:hypothetical protein
MSTRAGRELCARQSTSPDDASPDDEGPNQWPSRSVRTVKIFAVAGAADVLSRSGTDHLTSALKQRLFVKIPAST